MITCIALSVGFPRQRIRRSMIHNRTWCNR